MDKFQKEVLKKLDKIIELLIEEQKAKRMSLEDTKQNSNAPIHYLLLYPKDFIYRDAVFYSGNTSIECKCDYTTTSTDKTITL